MIKSKHFQKNYDSWMKNYNEFLRKNKINFSNSTMFSWILDILADGQKKVKSLK